MSRIKIIALTLIVSLIFVLGWFLYQGLKEDIFPKRENITTLKFEKLKKQLFFRSKIWGVSGSHEEIVLSESQSGIADKKVDYVFYTSEIYFKIEKNCSLIIYAPENLTSVPSQKFTDVTVILNDLKTAGEISKLKRENKKYGLSKVSVYN